MVIAQLWWDVSFVGPNSEWFWVAIQAIVVTATLIMIYRQVRLQSNSHLVNSFAEFERRWNSSYMLQARKHVCENYRPDNRRVDSMMHFLCTFFEELGVFCSRRVLDIEIAWEIYSFEIEHFWEIAKNPIGVFRKEQNDPSFYKHLESLHAEMLKFGRKKGAPGSGRTVEELNSFVKHELERVEFLLKVEQAASPEGNLRRLLAQQSNGHIEKPSESPKPR